MVRSMYSGVAGMKAQQSAMDVIGNNIANVKTYGYKASRANFSDVYYQTLSSGSSATGNRGGTNPTQIGYGVQLSGIDVLHGQSSFSMTGRSMDLAIAGEGFLQVQDGDGNTFYTRAGQLLFDPAGNLVDSNGNFVLGVSGDPLGREPGNDKIQMAIPSVDPSSSKVTETINNAKITITTSNNTSAGNVSINFISDGTMPGGQKVKAELTGGGSGVTLKINPTETFANQAALNDAINQAITEANGGKAHPAGKFSVSIDPASKFAGPLTGSEVVSKDYSVTPGKFTGFPTDGVFSGMKIESTSSGFTGKADATGVSMSCTYEAATTTAPITPERWKVTMTVDGNDYIGYVDKDMPAKDFVLKKDGTSETDYITMSQPGFAAVTAGAPGPTTDYAAPNTAGVAVTPATPSKNLGFGSKVIKLNGGTEGGPQGPENLDSIMIGADGIITAKHGVHGEIPIGRIDLVTFANPQGLQQAGNTYFASSANSGKISYCQPGTKGSGELATGSLEQSNVDLSQEFSDMITTQRAYQANSRLITVSDTMLEELVNLKR
ncbi:MAG: flagellar hook-basal body complex protein [Angelakisella sp.]